MGMSGGGVGDSSGSSAGGGNTGGSGGAGGAGDSSSGPSGSGGGDSSSAGSGAAGSSSAGGGDSGSSYAGDSFAGTMSEAAKGDDQKSDEASSKASGQNSTTSGITDAAGQTLGGLSDPSTDDDDDAADKAAQNAARESHHANEFDGLGPSGGPVSGQDSLNSHRGYGPDGSLAGGIDQDVNANTEQTNDDKSVTPNTDAANLVGPAGYGAAGLQGGLEAYRDHVDRGARSTAAGTLTNGRAGSLPAPGYANRADLAHTITNSQMTTGKALDATPYGPNAKSTQQLSAGAKTTSTIGRFANGAGLAIQPGAGAIQGFMNTPEDASWTERATNTVVGAVKEFDDTGLSYGAGLVTGIGTVAVSPFTGPAAPVVAGSAPVTATAAAVSTGLAYDNSSIDQAIDGFIEDYGRPGLLGALNAVDNYVVDPISGFIDQTFGDETADDESR